MAGGHFSIRLEWHLKASEHALPILCRQILKELSGLGLTIFTDRLNERTSIIPRLEKSATQACIILYSPSSMVDRLSTKCSVPKGLSGLRLPIARHRKGRVEGYPHRPLENNYMLRDCRAASNLMERRTN